MSTEVYSINYEIQTTFSNNKKKFYFSHSKSVKYRKDSIFPDGYSPTDRLRRQHGYSHFWKSPAPQPGYLAKVLRVCQEWYGN